MVMVVYLVSYLMSLWQGSWHDDDYGLHGMIWYIFWPATYDDLSDLVGIHDEWARDMVHLWLWLGLGLVYGLD